MAVCVVSLLLHIQISHDHAVSNDVKMIFWYLYWFQILKDQCGSVPSIFVAVLERGILSTLQSQCPRTDLNKRFLPRPKTITAWKLIPYRSKISKNWNPLRWVPLYRFFKTWFLLIQKQPYINYIQTHFT